MKVGGADSLLASGEVITETRDALDSVSLHHNTGPMTNKRNGSKNPMSSYSCPVSSFCFLFHSSGSIPFILNANWFS